MALCAGGVLWATQVPVHGHFWSALAGPFFIAGAGTAFGFIPISIAGLASGLLNTSQQIGGAIGIAIASTVAATHVKTLLGEGQTPGAALTGGFHWALWVCEPSPCSPCRPQPPFCAARQPPPTPPLPSQRPAPGKPYIRSRRSPDDTGAGRLQGQADVLTLRGAQIQEITAFLTPDALHGFGLPGAVLANS